MLRFALVAYLNITVVLGPGLCCCSAHFLFPWAGETGCCGSPHAEVASKDHHSNSHHHDHGPSQHDHSAIAHEDAHPQQAPSNHNQNDCPCGQHQQTLFASQPGDGATVRSLDLQVHVFWTLAVDVAHLNISGPDCRSALVIGLVRPCELSGREILRAHHRLQC